MYLIKKIADDPKVISTYLDYICAIVPILLWLNAVYICYFKHVWKIHFFNCDCLARNILKRMQKWQNTPNLCAAEEKCVGKVFHDLVEEINEASESIFIATPEFTMPELLECINGAHSRGIDIKIIVNNADGLENLPHIKALLSEGKTTHYNFISEVKDIRKYHSLRH